MVDTAKPWQLSGVYGNGIPALSLLHQEIDQFYSWLCTTPTEFYLRAEAVRRIEDVVLTLWPSACVEVFGSFRTGLNLPDSDIDLVVYHGHYWNPGTPLHELKRELVARKVPEIDTVSVLDKASVPVVKFTERISRIKFDVTFNAAATSGVQAAELIKQFIRQFPELPKLVMVLKHFLQLQGLNEVYSSGGVSSYALTLMVISFLQQQKRSNKRYASNNKLALLLLQFLDYYGRKFDFFKYGISVLGNGGCVEKERLRSALGENNWQSVLSIEDPVTPTNDIGRSSWQALHVMQGFEAAFLKLSKLVDSDSSKIVGPILASIVEVPQSLVNYRAWVHVNFQHLLGPGSGSGSAPATNPNGHSQSSGLPSFSRSNSASEDERSDSPLMVRKGFRRCGDGPPQNLDLDLAKLKLN
ncbi:inactive non-canonical poly(A) RNA polymerase protein Trf4-2 [Drosophila gunungcola]|uniref:inactive non-canonical poly(A) RNA polymerase protein Trf4-2 n=1 Tax=Drosophila gunungcola TaxID=103775 RepID=UPI0022E049A8|nr:inactive non-canonical poly(A) RNA polymerase protein Trf4-2 [Drosophila gunungcola]XP_052858971.1 inactive non-canonical poly(A) RNA polymerase protein Trf4-2 [Drosophila gunungcola]